MPRLSVQSVKQTANGGFFAPEYFKIEQNWSNSSGFKQRVDFAHQK